MRKPKQIIIQVDDEKSVHALEGSKADKFETTMRDFEDVLATHFRVNPMKNS